MPLILPIKNLAVNAVQKCLLAPNMVWNTMLPPQKSTCYVEEKNNNPYCFYSSDNLQNSTESLPLRVADHRLYNDSIIQKFNTLLRSCLHMDHEGIPRLAVELVPRPLQSTSRKSCQCDYRVQGPHKTYFKAYIIHYHNPTDLGWDSPKRCYV